MTSPNPSAPPPPAFLSALCEWLKTRLPGDWDGATLKAFTQGQSNPTYLLQAGAYAYVLRTRPAGVLHASAHAIDREFRVLEALAGSAVPVPAPRLYCDDSGLIGVAFYVMDYVPGRLLADPALPELSPDDRRAAYASFVNTLAELHSIDPASVGLGDFGRPGQYYERQISRWTRQYRAAETETIPAMEHLLAWLPDNLPREETVSLVHGDYRFENLLFHPTAPTVSAVLDWELSTLGDPLADLAYAALWHRLPPHAFRGLAGRAAQCPGVPSEAEFVADYCARVGRAPIANWRFYMAFSFFRLAAILQGVRRRALDGNAAAPDALQRGALAGLCAELGWDAAQRG